MKITVTFRHLQATDALKEHVEQKLARFKKYFIHPIDAHVILSVEKFRQQCEIAFRASHFNATAVEINHDLYTSIDKAIHKIERQIKKHKEILKEHKHRLSVHQTSAVAEQEYQQVSVEQAS